MTSDATALWPGFDDAADRIMRGYKTVGEVAYELIRDAIVSGALAPGRKLRQEALAQALGTSRIPVRTALMRLETEGLVDFHPRRGAVVRELTASLVREVYEIRQVLEVHALRRAVARMTEQDIDALRELAKIVDGRSEGTDFVAARTDFYAKLYAVSDNPELTKLIEDLRHRVSSHLLGRRVAHGESSGRGTHGQLIEYLAAGEEKRAEAWLTSHLATVCHAIEDMVTEPAANSDDRREEA